MDRDTRQIPVLVESLETICFTCWWRGRGRGEERGGRVRGEEGRGGEENRGKGRGERNTGESPVEVLRMTARDA